MTLAKVVTVVCMALVLVAGAGITAMAAERTASGAASFGPVIERKIAFSSGKANSCLNLDSGGWVDVGKAASMTELRKTGAQLYRSGIQSNLNDLTALGVYLIPLEDREWDRLSAGELVKQYQLDESSRRVSWNGEAFFRPGTYLFYTGNNLGLLQVLPLVPGGALDGVAVRYRLVQQGPSATQPTTGLTPDGKAEATPLAVPASLRQKELEEQLQSAQARLAERRSTYGASSKIVLEAERSVKIIESAIRRESEHPTVAVPTTPRQKELEEQLQLAQARAAELRSKDGALSATVLEAERRVKVIESAIRRESEHATSRPVGTN